MSIVEMKVPVIGESISEVTLSSWLKADGEYVNLDEPICEFESDKATLEFPAEASGKLLHVASEDDDLLIGALLAKIDTSVSREGQNNDDVPEDTKSTEEKHESPASTMTGEKVEMKVPVIGESISEVTLSSWLVENGSVVLDSGIGNPVYEYSATHAYAVLTSTSDIS